MTAYRPGHRRNLTAAQRSLRNELIARLHLYGVSISQIGRTLSLSRKCVHYELSKPRVRRATCARAT